MKGFLRNMTLVFLTLAGLVTALPASAQPDVNNEPKPRSPKVKPIQGYYWMLDEETGDSTICIVISNITVYPPMKFKNKKQEEFYWRTVRDVKKTLPYAKLICETLIETYEYTYDEKGRVASLLKTDQLQQAVLLDLSYSYPDETGMKALGKFYPVTSNRYVTAVRNTSEQTVSYNGSWTGAWAYVTRYDAGGTALSTETDLDFNAKDGQYSAQTHMGEKYTVSGGCITRAAYGAEIKAQTSRKTRSVSDSELTVSYTGTILQKVALIVTGRIA